MRSGARAASVAALWLGSFAALRLSFLAPEDCAPPSPAVMEQAAVAAGDWLGRARATDGRYVYEYDRREDSVGPGYNIVRHAGVTMSLYQLVRAGHGAALAPADRSLDVMRSALVPAGGGLAFGDGGPSGALGRQRPDGGSAGAAARRRRVTTASTTSSALSVVSSLAR